MGGRQALHREARKAACHLTDLTTGPRDSALLSLPCKVVGRGAWRGRLVWESRVIETGNTWEVRGKIVNTSS